MFPLWTDLSVRINAIAAGINVPPDLSFSECSSYFNPLAVIGRKMPHENK